MAPRSTIKRKKSEAQEKPMKRTSSIASAVTSSTTTATRKSSQPLAPSTSQNSVVKATASSKHKPRKSSSQTSQPKVEPITTVTKQQQKSRHHVPTTHAAVPSPKLNVYVFGSGSMGELGLGPLSSQRNVKRPRLNQYLLPQDIGIVDIAVGGMHCAAIDEKGQVWTWGVNDQGVLGRDTTWSPENEDTAMDSDDEDEEQLNPKESHPGLVEGFPEGTVVTKVACGDSITVAVTDEGKVYAWGTFRCSEGLLGFSPTVRLSPRPTLIPTLKDVTQIVCGVDHVLALTSQGKVFSWGNGQQLQLGRRVVERTRLNNLLPREFGLRNVRAIGAGSYHSFAISNDGDVYAWGLNQFGQCGIDRQGYVGEDGAVISSPSVVEDLSGYDVIAVTGGEHHSVALTASGELLSFGRMDCNQLGFPSSSPPQGAVVDSRGVARFTPYPTVIPNVPPMRKVFCGSHHNIAIAKDGSAWSWGFGEVWQVGQGPHTAENPSGDIEVPTKIVNTATKDVNMITGGAGGQFSVLCGIPKDGEAPNLPRRRAK